MTSDDYRKLVNGCFPSCHPYSPYSALREPK